MRLEHVRSPTDPRTTNYRAIGDPELLRSHRLFVAEGRLVVRRVIEDGRYRVRSVLVNEAARADLGPVLERLDGDVPVYVCEAQAFYDITGFDIHRGCLALVERPTETPLDAVLASGSRAVVLDGVTNADNVGGVFRNAAAFRMDGVVLSPTACDPLYRKAIRTSMGAALSVSFARVEAGDWPGVLTRVRASGATILALTPREPSEALDDFAVRWGQARRRLALVVGAEATGLSPAVEAAADYRVRIPISHRVDSLNLAVATGIALQRLRI